MREVMVGELFCYRRYGRFRTIEDVNESLSYLGIC